jgi:hypothetical protein
LAQETKNGKNIPRRGKIYKMTIKYTKRPDNRTNGHKIYQHLPLQDPPKFTQIRVLGLKAIPSGNPGVQRDT